jgi:sec-independent protein translocase protein TatA
MSLGFGEILLILLIVLLLFGAKRLPELARGLGQGMREFRKATSEIQDEIESAVKPDQPPNNSGDKPSGESGNTPT